MDALIGNDINVIEIIMKVQEIVLIHDHGEYIDCMFEMYEQEHSYRVISDFLYSKGYEVSYMSLSRHFNKHYPKKEGLP